MKKIILSAFVILGLAGCATPQQNAALAGAIVGAAIMGGAYSQPHYHRPAYCTNRPTIIGYDYYRKPIYQYQRVCSY